MASYKLIYFHGKGRAENTRMLFTLAGQKFDDVRLTHEEWLSYKPETPYGQLPVLEMDGAKLCQSAAIEMYVAKTLGLAGNNELTSAKILMVMMCIEDLYVPLNTLFNDKATDKEKDEVREKMKNKTLPDALSNLEKFVACDKLFFEDKLTLADLAFYNGMQMMKTCGIHFTLPKKLDDVCKSVEANTILADYMEKRPLTDY